MCKAPKAAETQVVSMPPPSTMPAALGSAYEDTGRANTGVAALRVASRNSVSRLSIRGRQPAAVVPPVT